MESILVHIFEIFEIFEMIEHKFRLKDHLLQLTHRKCFMAGKRTTDEIARMTTVKLTKNSNRNFEEMKSSWTRWTMVLRGVWINVF